MSFQFHRNGSSSMHYTGGRKPRTVLVEVASVKGNTACFKEARGFSGGCVSLFKTLSGGYMADAVFGNGQMRTFKASGLKG